MLAMLRNQSILSGFQKYLLPGFVFQSVVVAGGYGTGRELVEFFLSLGVRSGLLAMGVTMLIWSAVSAVSFEFARSRGTYDYRTFCQALLGRGWVLFEIAYVVLLLLVIAVIGAAAGEIVSQSFGLPYWTGVAGIMLSVATLIFLGNKTIERALAGWSLLLYVVFAVLFVWSLMRFGPDLGQAFRTSELTGGWVMGGVQYAAYNLAVIPAILFVVRHFETRREAIGAGVIAGGLGIFPGVLFYLAMAAHHPTILGEAVPANFILAQLGSPAFSLVFQIVLFGTLIETGTGLLHAVNERIAGTAKERGLILDPRQRVAVAMALLLIATLVSRIGLVDLIARGYGTLTWVFLIVYVIPVLTLGVWKITRGRLPPTVEDQ